MAERTDNMPMKTFHNQERAAQAVQNLGNQLLGLAASSWNMMKEHPTITQEVMKDPFTSEAKVQSATAELLIFLLHACDRVASATFRSTLPAQAAEVLRNSLMTGLVGVTLPAFARTACPDEDADEQEETQADLLHLYNARATQYGFFILGGNNTSDNGTLFTLAGIRLAEAIECPENAEAISHGVEVILSSLVGLREKLSLKDVIGEMIAGVQ